MVPGNGRVFSIQSRQNERYSKIQFFQTKPNRFQLFYSGCQKNVPIFERFFLQPLMPHFLNSEQNYEKRYKTKKANDNIEIIDIMAFYFA
jgi:hypothetical protein